MPVGTRVTDTPDEVHADVLVPSVSHRPACFAPAQPGGVCRQADFPGALRVAVAARRSTSGPTR
jgi:hypothetical protein